MINILLIDQEPLFQQAFSRMIAETEECQLIGIAENSKEAFELQAAIIHRLYFVMLFLAWRMELLSVILLRSIFLRLRPIFYQITVVSR